MAEGLTLAEAAKVFGKPVRNIAEVATRGTADEGRERLTVPSRFEVKHSRVTRSIGVLSVVMDRRELWGDDRLLWAIESGTPAR